ncbi:YLS9 protein [Nymphaea thermarum]|nr:YLS9 protein [Nymphaea thermarum]
MPFDQGQIQKQANNQMKQSSSPLQGTVISAGQQHNHQLYPDPSVNDDVESKSSHGRVLSLLLKFVIAFSVILCFGDLIGLFLLKPAMVEVRFEKASLTKFSFTNKNILNFDLALDVRVRNPNKKIGIYYESLEAVAFYEGERLGAVSVPSFYQEPENTTHVHPVFRGQFPAGRGYGVFRDYILGRHQGWFEAEVKFFTKFWLKSSNGQDVRLNFTL